MNVLPGAAPWFVTLNTSLGDGCEQSRTEANETGTETRGALPRRAQFWAGRETKPLQSVVGMRMHLWAVHPSYDWSTPSPSRFLI
jgi:hypothetical protein